MAADVAARTNDAERLRLVIEAAPNAMLLVDARGQIVLVNSEAVRAFGYSRAELLGMVIEDLVPERFRTSHAGDRQGFFHMPHRRRMGLGRELFGLRKDGAEVPIEIGLNPIETGEDSYVLASVIEISERLRGQNEEAAQRQDELRRSILDTIPFSIIATDAEGRILTVNPAAMRLLGYGSDELIGASLAKIDADPRTLTREGNLAPADDDDVEWTYRRKDGRRVPVNEAIVDLRDAEGEPAGFLVVAYDITQRIEARASVEYLAAHDALTNLPNRITLMQHLEKSIAAAEESGKELALLLLDLDHFKRVNDSLGHHVGDELLLRVSERLFDWIRRGDLVARLGGDEFVVVFAGLKPGTDLEERVDELQADLGPVEVDGYQVVVTASIGAALFPRDGATPSQLLKNADVAMYRAKAEGRDTAKWFTPDMLGEADEKLSLSAALQRAMGSGELSTAYQPQVNLRTGELVGFEALARWDSPELGTVTPDRFIPVAEDGGMIRELGNCVLRTACRDIAALQRQLGRRLRLAVNVSPRQLRGQVWLDEVLSALDAAGLRPDQLELEITEGVLIADHGNAIDLLNRVRATGVRIAVDDFGCGYSSLAYLATFPIDKLKIDRSFIEGITAADGHAAIVDAIIVMAHALGLEVIAEGVETGEQEEYLLRRNCDEGQGFYYGPGLPVGQVPAYVRRFSQA